MSETTVSVGNYAPVNGLNLYYEIHGAGQPLVLLHGGLGSIEMFGDLLPQLAEGRQVVAVDLQAHGRTADIDRPMRLELMADDIAALIEHLGLERVDVMGYSLGGGVAWQTAIRHPQLVRRLVTVSAVVKRSGCYPEVVAAIGGVNAEAAEAMKPSPVYQLYASIAPRPQDWPTLVTKMGELLQQDYDWSADVAKIKAPTLIVVGDADMMPPAYAVEMFELLGGGQRDGGWDGSGMSSARLAILPGTTHYTILDSPALVPAVVPFLDAAASEETQE
ncbi:MAG: alpha/beta hydrolase [Anaerolineae bacterium]